MIHKLVQLGVQSGCVRIRISLSMPSPIITPIEAPLPKTHTPTQTHVVSQSWFCTSFVRPTLVSSPDKPVFSLLVVCHWHPLATAVPNRGLTLNTAIQLRTSIDTTGASTPSCAIPCVESRPDVLGGRCRRHVSSTLCRRRGRDRRWWV